MKKPLSSVSQSCIWFYCEPFSVPRQVILRWRCVYNDMQQINNSRTNNNIKRIPAYLLMDVHPAVLQHLNGQAKRLLLLLLQRTCLPGRSMRLPGLVNRRRSRSPDTIVLNTCVPTHLAESWKMRITNTNHINSLRVTVKTDNRMKTVDPDVAGHSL